jgi:hypothetical protein
MDPKQRNYRHCRSRHFKAIRLSRSRWRRTGIGGQSVAFGRDVITLGVGSGGGWSPVDRRPEFRPAQSLSANYITARPPSRNCPSFSVSFNESIEVFDQKYWDVASTFQLALQSPEFRPSVRCNKSPAAPSDYSRHLQEQDHSCL